MDRVHIGQELLIYAQPANDIYIIRIIGREHLQGLVQAAAHPCPFHLIIPVPGQHHVHAVSLRLGSRQAFQGFPAHDPHLARCFPHQHLLVSRYGHQTASVFSNGPVPVGRHKDVHSPCLLV